MAEATPGEEGKKYLDLDEGTRDEIIRYIFARQRKVLRNEKTEEAV